MEINEPAGTPSSRALLLWEQWLCGICPSSPPPPPATSHAMHTTVAQQCWLTNFLNPLPGMLTATCLSVSNGQRCGVSIQKKQQVHSRFLRRRASQSQEHRIIEGSVEVNILFGRYITEALIPYLIPTRPYVTGLTTDAGTQH